MATELGKAYVQIIPSARGISRAITDELAPESESAGRTAGNKIVSAVKGAITVAAIGKFFGESLKEGAALQQSLGGVETLFKDHADKVISNANRAYETAGLSANEYMENVTSFSASLLQSVAWDTDKAADIADMAMIDTSDNANKFGTDMRDIQNAYQGFAKQNFTMLDNLKLGYGGTKTEMERLLKDAQKLSGVEYSIDSLADMYNAIHVIQKEMEVTVTTALEASETFSGSFNAMKSAAKNALGALALGENIAPALSGLAKTVSTFLFDNFLPMVLTIIKSLIPAIGELLITGVPQLIEAGFGMIQSISDGLTTGFPEALDNMGLLLEDILSKLFDAIPELIDRGFKLISGLAKGLIDNLPAVGESMTKILSKLLQLIIDKAPDILKSGIELIGELAMGLWNNLPHIISTIGNILTNLVRTIRENLPEFLQKGLELVWELAKGLVKAIPDIVAKIPSLIWAIVRSIGGMIGEFVGIGGDIVRGLWRGIASVKDWILSKIRGFTSSIVSGIKGFFGISSPSKVFAEVGRQLNEGLAMGITDNTKPIMNAIDDVAKLTTQGFESEVSVSATIPKTIRGLSSELGISTPTQPAYFTLNLSGHRFQAFVDDITKLQDRETELQLSY